MSYVPILGFIYAAIRALWAQHQLSIGAMSFRTECEYFDQFQVALLVTASTIVILLKVTRLMKPKDTPQ